MSTAQYIPAPPTVFVFYTQLITGELYYIRQSPTALQPIRYIGLAEARGPENRHLFYYTDPALRELTGHVSFLDSEVITMIQKHINPNMTQDEYVALGGRF
jgi:hypothetical protein